MAKASPLDLCFAPGPTLSTEKKITYKESHPFTSTYSSRKKLMKHKYNLETYKLEISLVCARDGISTDVYKGWE